MKSKTFKIADVHFTEKTSKHIREAIISFLKSKRDGKIFRKDEFPQNDFIMRNSIKSEKDFTFEIIQLWLDENIDKLIIKSNNDESWLPPERSSYHFIKNFSGYSLMFLTSQYCVRCEQYEQKQIKICDLIPNDSGICLYIKSEKLKRKVENAKD